MSAPAVQAVETTPATRLHLAEQRPPRMRARIRAVVEVTSSSDPREIAAKLLTDIDDADLRDILAEVLPEYVRVILKNGRNSAMSPAPAGPSAKVAAVRSWHERLMAQPIDVSGDGGRWKALRDCTRDELLQVAQHRRIVASKNLAVADRYEALAKVLPTGKTVGQLPADAVANVFGRAAE